MAWHPYHLDHLAQDIVKPQTRLGVCLQQRGQVGNRIQAMVMHLNAQRFQMAAVAQAKQEGHQGVDVVNVDAFEALQPGRGQHPTGAATDQQQMRLRGLHLR